MKKLTLCFFFLALASGLLAQNTEQEVRKATGEAVALYQLDERQAEEMQVIQERRFRNLASIEELRQSDYNLYLQKKNSVREGMMASIKRLLKEEQMEVFHQQLVDRRKKEAAVKEQLKQEGASRQEIQIAIWELE
ncbi:MAG: hypothetical protein KDD06_19310 [Phaeodactylibacter sp.]|nr:hypothetical protein [Phaeodactylibacter sp.]MCB9264428.1 hypothetical protein [Lewinellaceae bacterium]MCB9286229.1 hypothetical protein [Lewinellaceae bacterium]